MMDSLFRTYLKEWMRGGNGRRLIQIIVLVILPVMIYVFSVVTSSGLFSRVPMVLSAGSFMVFIVSAIYSFSYRGEAEDKVTEDFPMEYLPVRQGYAYAMQIMFVTVLLYLVTALSLIISSLILNAIVIDGRRMYPFLKSISIMAPLFAGLLYTVPMASLFGGFLGSVARKIADNFSGGLRRSVMLILYVITFIVFRKYFSDSYAFMNREGFLESGYLFSIAGLSSLVLNLFFGEFNLLHCILSTAFTVLLAFSYVWINSLKWKFVRDFEFHAEIGSRRVGWLSEMWNLVLKRVFTTPMMILLTLYMALIVSVSLFPQAPALYAVLGLLSYVYLFLFLDRIFPSKNENYRHILDMLPISAGSINGMVLGVYYLLFLLPFFAGTYAIMQNSGAMNGFMQSPKTLSQFVASFMLPVAISAIVPSILTANPYFLSENDRGRRTSRGSVIVILIFSYIFFSNLALFMNMYLVNPMFQDFVRKMFWNKGYYVFKTFAYFLFLAAVFVHLQSLSSFILSLKNDDGSLKKRAG